MRQVRAVGTAPVGDPAVGDFGIGIIKGTSRKSFRKGENLCHDFRENTEGAAPKGAAPSRFPSAQGFRGLQFYFARIHPVSAAPRKCAAYFGYARAPLRVGRARNRP